MNPRIVLSTFSFLFLTLLGTQEAYSQSRLSEMFGRLLRTRTTNCSPSKPCVYCYMGQPCYACVNGQKCMICAGSQTTAYNGSTTVAGTSLDFKIDRIQTKLDKIQPAETPSLKKLETDLEAIRRMLDPDGSGPSSVLENMDTTKLLRDLDRTIGLVRMHRLAGEENLVFRKSAQSPRTASVK